MRIWLYGYNDDYAIVRWSDVAAGEECLSATTLPSPRALFESLIDTPANAMAVRAALASLDSARSLSDLDGRDAARALVVAFDRGDVVLVRRRRTLAVASAERPVVREERDPLAGEPEIEWRRREPEPELGDLWIRLAIDPADADSHDDRFVLTSTDNAYRAEKTIRDDQIPNDDSVDLLFTDLDKSKSYTLRVIESADGASYSVFQGVAYADLASLAPAASPAEPAEHEGESLGGPAESVRAETLRALLGALGI